MKVAVRDLIGRIGVTLDDGRALYGRIHPELLAGRAVELDFAGVEVLASPFLNAAIGHLLKDIAPDDLNRLLTIENLTPAGRAVLARVIENSKAYYGADPALRKALDDVLAEQAENA